MNEIVKDNTIETVLRAVFHNKMLEFDYTKADGTQSRRAVIPLDFTRSDSTNEWRIFGWCTLRGALRSFRHDRISDLALSSKGFFNQYKTLYKGDEFSTFIILRDSIESIPKLVIKASYKGTKLYGNLMESGISNPVSILSTDEASNHFNELISLGYSD